MTLTLYGFSRIVSLRNIGRDTRITFSRARIFIAGCFFLIEIQKLGISILKLFPVKRLSVFLKTPSAIEHINNLRP